MLHLRTLGGFDIRADDGRVMTTVVAQPKRAALLLVLAAAGRDAIVRRDTLLPLFWPERDTDSARAALRRALHFLRRELGERAIVGVGTEALRLDAAEITADLWQLDDAVKCGDHAGALACASGEFAPGLHVNDAPEFNRWLDARRESIRRDTIRAASNALTTALARRDTDSAISAGRRLTEIAPDEESSWRALIDAQRATGDVPAAIATYNKYAAYLRDELDLEPSSDLETLASAPVAPAANRRVPIDSMPAATPASITRARRRRPRWRVAAVTCIAILMTAAVWSAARVARASTSDANGVNVVAVLPFSVNGGADVQYLADGLVDLLSLRLDAGGTSRPVASRAVLSRFGGRAAFGESNAARAAAEARSSLGATRVVIGAVTQVGESLELAARLVAANGTVLTVATAHANTERDLPAAVDDIARGVLATLAGRRVELTSATTPSLDALKSFIAGEREFREGRFDAAIVNYRAAIRADTTFGRAYARLSAALSEATNVQARDASAMAVTARRFADHLPSVERLLVLGHAEFYAGSAQAAEQYFRAATSAAPEDIEAWLGLGESIFHGNPIDGHPLSAARSAFARALTLDPGNPTALEHLSRLDAWDRNSDSLIRRTVQLNPEARGDVRGREIVALATFATGDSATKARLVTELATVAPRDAWRIAWTTAHYARAYSEAERILAGIGKRIVPSRRHGLVNVARAHFLAAAGRVPAAYALLDSARAEAPVEALCTRAQFVLLLDPSRVRSGEREAVVRELRAWDGQLAEPDAWFEEEFEEDGPSIRAYYLARLGAAPAGPYAPSSMVPALLAASHGDYESAIRIAQNPGARYVRMRRSLRFNRGLDRLLIGQWLLAAGNAPDAVRWLSSIPEDRGYDVLLIDRAGLLGRMALAAAHNDPVPTDAEPITHFP